jgi:hypothetical protein
MMRRTNTASSSETTSGWQNLWTARIRSISTATYEDILPAFYSDNYFSLMPGESKTVTVEFNPSHLKGGLPIFELSGWNTTVEAITHEP